MKSNDERSVPARSGRFELRERASRFLAFAVSCPNPGEAAAKLAAWRREFHDATHIAFAWRIGDPELAATRASDAGEPSGTAGRPIATAILSAELTDVLVAVVRWYGGTKLGTGGLARAYRDAAAGALADAGRTTRAATRTVAVTCGWTRLGEVRRLIQPPEITLRDQAFGEAARVRLTVYRSRVAQLLARLEEARLDYVVEEEREGEGPEDGEGDGGTKADD